MHMPEVVVHEVQGDGVDVILELLTETIGESPLCYII
jgi:hypothetical protein